MPKGFFTSVYRFMYFILLVRMRLFSPVWLLPWFFNVVIVLESLVTMHATKGFFTIVDSFVYFHIAGKNEVFSPVWLLPWFLTIVIVLESLVKIHTSSSMAIPFGQWE